MKIKIKETRHTRNVSVEIPIQKPNEEFVGLLDMANSPTKLKPLIEHAYRGLKKFSPELCEDGVGGTYFLRSPDHQIVGVFKPQDEEPYNVNNPKGYAPRRGSDAGLKEGIKVGEAALRECVAYMLDHDNFAGVPVTDLVLAQHPAFYWNEKDDEASIDDADLIDVEDVFSSPRPVPKAKIGSFQEFIPHDGDCEDISRKLVAQFPVDEVHKIAQLDIRIMNSDRHGGNILYRRAEDEDGVQAYELIPIDHGYALPATLDGAWFEWLTWPQVKQPMSHKTREYIASLDVDNEIAMLRTKFGNTIRPEHFRVLRISTTLLQKGAAAGLTLYQIATIVSRYNPTVACSLENMVSLALQKAKKSPNGSINEESFFDELSLIMDAEIAQIMTQTKV